MMAVFRSWLARITVNACYDELRRWSRRPVQSLEMISSDGEKIDPNDWLADPAPSLDFQVESMELAQAIQTALQSLPPLYRIVAVLVDVEGFAYDEAAKILDIPIGTVKSRLARARSQLRHALRNIEELIPVGNLF